MNMVNKNQKGLPYFKLKTSSQHFVIASYLRRKFLPSLKKKFPLHYLTTREIRLYLKFIKEASQKYPYFLRFDISRYFPSINHRLLLKNLPLVYQRLLQRSPSRRLKCILKKDLPAFLNLSPLKNLGLPLGNPLSHILAGIYLLELDLSLKNPFLRFCDDYLLFGKSEKELQEILSKKILPLLEQLSLSLNLEKIQSGRFWQQKCEFLGFEFIAGHIRISEEKISHFKKKIIKITHLTKKKPILAVIKLLNRQIVGFGHYYKFANCQNVFKELDAFLRSRLRRYILRNRNLSPKTGNLFLSNQVLKELGLKSLQEIKQKYDQKFAKKSQKSQKIKQKTVPSQFSQKLINFSETSFQYKQDLILKKLFEIDKNLEKLQRKIIKIERKFESLKSLEKSRKNLFWRLISFWKRTKG